MRLELRNFGQFTCRDFTLVTHVQAPNGWGKTTLINAYIFTLSGRTINGFEPRNVDAPEHENTSVTLLNWGEFDEIRRVLKPSGSTTLYVNGDVMTQSEFATLVNVPLAVACANVTQLADPALTVEELRKLLVLTNVLDGEDVARLRKEQKRVRDAKRSAEQYALSNVIIPQHTIDEPSVSDRRFIDEFQQAKYTLEQGVREVCKECGQPLPSDDVERQRANVAKAEIFVKEYQSEFDRLIANVIAYNQEEDEINNAKRLVALASKAREDVVRFTDELAQLDEQIRRADEQVLNAALPEHVVVITEQTAKNGKTSSTCTLTYKGVPLKSVNYAARVQICIGLMLRARMDAFCPWLPIIVDNAESVTGLRNIPNLITLNVG